MKKKGVLLLMLVLSVAGAYAQEMRIPYQLSLGVGYIPSFGDWIGVQDQDGEGPDSLWTQGSGNSRVALDGTINMGKRRRFGLGIAYRRYAPDNGYAVNAVGPVIAWTNPYSESVVSQWMLASGYAAIALDDSGMDETVSGDVSYGANVGAFIELQWRLAFPVVDLTQFSGNRVLTLAPHVGVAAGAAFMAREIEFAYASIDENQYYLYVDNFNTTISLGATIMVVESE